MTHEQPISAKQNFMCRSTKDKIISSEAHAGPNLVMVYFESSLCVYSDHYTYQSLNVLLMSILLFMFSIDSLQLTWILPILVIFCHVIKIFSCSNMSEFKFVKWKY